MDHRVINYVQDLFSVAGTGAGGVELQLCCHTYCTYFCTCLVWFIIFWMENGKVFEFTRTLKSSTDVSMM